MAKRVRAWYRAVVVRKLKVDRFKSIRNAMLELGRINIFIGGNGAGKSNILEAIGILSAAVDRGVGDSDLRRKGVRLTPPELMKSAFKNDELPETLQLSAQLEDDVAYRINLTGSEKDPLLAFFGESCTHGEKEVFERSPHGATVLDQSVYGNLIKYRSIWDQVRTAYRFPMPVERALHGLSQYAIYSPQTSFLRGMQSGTVDTPPIGLHGEGLPEAVRGLIGQIRASDKSSPSSEQFADSTPSHDLKQRAIKLARLPQWASHVRVGSIERHLTSRDLLDHGEDMVYLVDRYMHDSRKTLSVYDSSEGTLFLLFVAILLSHDDSPRIFALDNVDNALNPRMTRSLLEATIETTKMSSSAQLGCGPRQVFLTSHNPTSLDAFDLFDDDERVFVVERNQEGHTTVTRLKPRDGMSRQEWYQAKNGRNLSQLWLDGEIRGALGQEL